MKHAILAILALAMASCSTTTTYTPDGGKVVVKSIDQGAITLATRGLEVFIVRYPTEPQK